MDARASPVVSTQPRATQKPGPGFDLWDAVFLALLTVTFEAALSVGAQGFAWRVLGFLVVMNAASLALGRALLGGKHAPFAMFEEYVLGVCVFSVIVLAVCVGTVTGAAIGAAVAALAGLVAGAICVRRKRVPPPGRAMPVGLAAVICAASFIWSWQAIIAVPHMRAYGVFAAWTDYFIHAGELVQFAQFGALHGTSIFAAGATLPLYHYASYMVPASLCGVSGMPALVCATVFWTLLGYVLLGLSASVLGAALAGEAGGVLAMVAVLLVPDAAHYGLENPFFDFHWLLQISASNCYGVALACLAESAMLRWLRRGGLADLAWAAGLTLAVFLFRVHIFAVLALTNAMLFIAGWRPRDWRVKPLAVLAGLVAAAAASAVTELFPRAPHFWSGPHHPVAALKAMLAMQPSAFANVYGNLVASVHVEGPVAHHLWLGGAVLAGLGILLFAAFGALVLVYGAGLIAAARRGARVEDFLPLLAVAAYFLIVAGFPDTPNEPYEFAHRPFVFPYTMLAVWCARDAALVLGRIAGPWRRFLPAGAALALLAVPLALEAKAQTSMLAWGSMYSATYVPQGLQAAAEFISLHAQPGDVVANAASPLDDVFLSLSERPALSPGTPFMVIQSGISADDAVTRRNDVTRALAGAAGPPVAWVVTYPGTPAGPGAVMTGGGYAVRRTVGG
jgi:hypothetical protein